MEARQRVQAEAGRDDEEAVTLLAESYGDSSVSIYRTHPQLSLRDSGHNPNGALLAQCLDSYDCHGRGDRSRIFLPSLGFGMVLDRTRGLDGLEPQKP
jgi:hypothetical protein